MGHFCAEIPGAIPGWMQELLALVALPTHCCHLLQETSLGAKKCSQKNLSRADLAAGTARASVYPQGGFVLIKTRIHSADFSVSPVVNELSQSQHRMFVPF